MTTSTPPSTSKSSDCHCSKDCGCCSRKALAAASAAAVAETAPAPPQPVPGFLAKRPWIWIFVAFGIMFSAWTVMFTMAIKNQPENVELVGAVPAATPTP